MSVIVALDVPTGEEALAWVARLPQVTAWKVGLELFCAEGPAIVRELKMQGKRVFLDVKLHDIPNTVAGACRQLRSLEVDWLTLHASGGPAMLQAAVETFAGTTTTLLAVTALTSLDAETLAHMGIGLPLADWVERLAGQAWQAGMGGMVCAPQEVARLRRVLGPTACLITPGIRLPGEDWGDQQRVATPHQAIAAGASYVVIGRSLLQAPDPEQAWHQLPT
ncbi:MAG TPA: orotidine-5'-phosphate decarboxylase [Cyanobacteria bacterium UBA8156]|jgi:orotidine-5'-phosphate decarboxylase|nr:orotidine-5'-phosphate decarboxylase [Cyanobacteria bacterium UBA8156]